MLVLRLRTSLPLGGCSPAPTLLSRSWPGPWRPFHASAVACCRAVVADPVMVVVGGGAAGVYAAVRAKSLAPHLGVLVVEKGKSLSKGLAEHYPRGHKELRGAFFSTHGPLDTMSWFADHGVELKTENDGRVFPVSDNSSTIIDCLLRETKK